MGSLLVGSVGRSPWLGSVDLESSVDPSKQTSKTGNSVGLVGTLQYQGVYPAAGGTYTVVVVYCCVVAFGHYNTAY